MEGSAAMKDMFLAAHLQEEHIEKFACPWKGVQDIFKAPSGL